MARDASRFTNASAIAKPIPRVPPVTTAINSMMNFFEMFFHSANKGPDIAAMGAIIGAGISYLVSRGRKIRLYNGIDLGSEAGWQRLEGAIDTMIQGTFAEVGK